MDKSKAEAVPQSDRGEFESAKSYLDKFRRWRGENKRDIEWWSKFSAAVETLEGANIIKDQNVRDKINRDRAWILTKPPKDISGEDIKKADELLDYLIEQLEKLG